MALNKRPDSPHETQDQIKFLSEQITNILKQVTPQEICEGKKRKVDNSLQNKTTNNKKQLKQKKLNRQKRDMEKSESFSDHLGKAFSAESKQFQ